MLTIYRITFTSTMALIFYLLASRNKMVGTSDIIRLINRDELSHVVLFQRIMKEIRIEYPDFFDYKEIKRNV